MHQDIVILDGARTAIGTFGGSLAAIPPIDLAAAAAREALSRAGVEGGRIGHVVFGHVINTEPRDMYLSRCAAIEAGIPDTTPAMNVNRLCGSGAQAIVSCVQALAMGDADFALAGGAESMSRAPHSMQVARFGQKRIGRFAQGACAVDEIEIFALAFGRKRALVEFQKGEVGHGVHDRRGKRRAPGQTAAPRHHDAGERMPAQPRVRKDRLKRCRAVVAVEEMQRQCPPGEARRVQRHDVGERRRSGDVDKQRLAGTVVLEAVRFG